MQLLYLLDLLAVALWCKTEWTIGLILKRTGEVACIHFAQPFGKLIT